MHLLPAVQGGPNESNQTDCNDQTDLTRKLLRVRDQGACWEHPDPPAKTLTYARNFPEPTLGLWTEDRARESETS